MNKRVLVSYDFVDTDEIHGINNHNRILRSFIQVIKKLPIEVIERLSGFEQNTFFQYSNMRASEGVFYDFQLSDISDKSKRYLRDCLDNYDLIIGCELSRNTRVLLDEFNIPYIDIWLSPVRFYKDVMFEFGTNDPAMQDKLNRYAFDESLLQAQISALTEHADNFLQPPKLAPNSCLLIGQMQQDKSVLYNGKYLSLLDYFSQIEDLSLLYNKVYLLKHPYLDANVFSPIARKLQTLSNVEIIENTNTYLLLMQDEIKCVAGISSSVLVEAEYFGKTTQFFYQGVIPIDYVRIFGDYFSTSFWSELLNISSDKAIRFSADDNYFRTTYGMAYSYDVFMPSDKQQRTSIASKYHCVVSLYNFVSHLDEAHEYVLYGFGSVGKLIFPHIKDKLIAIVDKKHVGLEQNSAYEGIPLKQPKDLSESFFEKHQDAKIIISSFLYKQAIMSELSHLRERLLIIEV